MTKPAVITNGSEGANDNPNGCKDCGWVHLMPYEFQVSGHHRVMLFDATTICKPVMAKEFAFYTSSPKELQKFIPEYRGEYNMKIFLLQTTHTNFNDPLIFVH